MPSTLISRVRSNFSRVSAIFSPWRDLLQEIYRYWKLYGGFKALLLSPYFQLSIVFGLIIPHLLHAYNNVAATAISIVPCLLGFSVGAMAILLAFSSSKIFPLIAEEGHERSLFMNMVTSFVHFIIVQAVCLCLAVLSTFAPKFFPLKVAVGIMVFYAIFTAVSVGMHLFGVALIYNKNEEP